MNKIIGILLAICVSSVSLAQVNINIAIAPPYSTRISDYANNPGKVILTLNYTAGAVGGTMRVLLRATVTGDNGIVLATKNNYMPPAPIELQPNVPKVVDIQTIRELFYINSFTVQGITSREIFDKGGLPEGNYQFCVRAFLYDNPNVAVSPAAPGGCTFIRLTQLDPPILVKPLDKEVVANNGIQNIIFSWNIAPGAEPGTQYLFRMIEMLDSTKNQNDAMNARTTPTFYETVVNNNILLYTPAHPLLVAGRKYAWAITALPGRNGTAYKNNGRSEVRSFVYGNPLPTINTTTDKISFILPNTKQNQFVVNNSKPLIISWNWFNDTQKTDTVFINDTLYKKYGVVKYVVNIEGLNNPSANQLSNKNFKTTFTINTINNSLASNISLTKSQLLQAGLQNNYWYTASVEAIDAQNKLVRKEKSVAFRVNLINEDNVPLVANVKAQIKYRFYGKPGLYNAINTPIEANILSLVKNTPPSSVLPQTSIGGEKYYVVGSAIGNTNKDGFLNININYNSPDATLPLFVHLKSLNGYYLIDSLTPQKISQQKDTGSVNLGQVIAHTLGYTLEVNVQKFYPAYNIKQNADGKLSFTVDTNNNNKQYAFDKDKGMYYNTGISTPQAGITVLLFRKDKKDYVPPVEGSITEGNSKQGFVMVAQGTTTIQKQNGKDVALVKFDNLLANIYAGDEYYLLVPDGKNFKYNNGKSTISLNGKEVSINTNTTLSEDFFAEEKIIKVPAPKTFFGIMLRDSLYRTISTNYNITSKKPPTSLVKGKLLYKWDSDKKGILRPYANQTFKIVVDYLADNQSIGAATKNTSNSKEVSYTEKFFVPENSSNTNNGMQLLDFGQTMAIGKTDAQGNFEIEVINVNPKGVIGKGKIVEKGWSIANPSGIKNEKEPNMPNIGGGVIKQNAINPADNFSGVLLGSSWMGNSQMPGGSSALALTNILNNASQGFLNSNLGGSFNSNTGFTELGVKQPGNMGNKANGSIGNGPNATFSSIDEVNNVVNNNTVEEEAITNEQDVLKFERVFRIVPDNTHLRQAQTFTVNAFEAANIGNQIAPVKEMTLQVTAKENNTLLSGMKVTVFRRLEDKTATLPIGEGDGLYQQKKIINPQYNGNNATFNNIYNNQLNKDNIYNTVFEHLWSGEVTNNNGTINLPALLANYNYYVQVCSDPTQGINFYQSYFTTTNFSSVIEAKLTSLPSRIFVRVLDNSNQQPIPYARVGVTSQSMLTDANGYAELKVTDYILKDVVKKDNDEVTLYASALGYNQESRKVTFAKLKGFQQSINISINPGKIISGKIISADENNKGVPAYIKLNNGSVTETDASGIFSLAVPNKDDVSVEIIPKDVAYFDTAFTIAKNITNLNNIQLYRRKHRVRLVIKDSEGKAINNATAELNNMSKQSNGFGIADFVFENVSINNYTCIIRGPQNSLYIPIAINIKNAESKDYAYYNVVLEKGSEIKGTVLLDGKPVKNAKVYVQYNSQLIPANNSLNANVNLNSAFSNEQGMYSLKGVPLNNQNIQVTAVLDTNFTVSGETKLTAIKNFAGNANFNLSSYKQMLITHIMGFPLTIEKIENSNKPDEVLVTGTIQWKNANSGFTWLNGTDILRVNKVAFKATTVNGIKVGVPVADVINIEGTASIKLNYLKKYNVNLFKANSQENGIPIPQELTISKQNDYGVIEGFVRIVDNSFNYPSTYINFTNKEQFYLADIINDKVVTQVTAVKSAVSITEANKASIESLDKFRQVVNNNINLLSTNQKLYNLANKDASDISFKFLQFNATANAKKSYIAKDGKIHLNVDMQCHIKNATPEKFTVNISNVVLDENNVYAAAGNNPINVQLEKWNLQVNNWKLDVKEGGIISNNSIIKTQAVDIPAQKFVLRSNMFIVDSFNLKGLMLGGGIHPLSNINTNNAALVYDLKTGSDMQPHWRFSISSNGTPVATINNLPGLNKAVKLNYLQTLSNNETVMQLMLESTPHIINNNAKAQFSPEVITNGTDFFDIYGALNINVPRAAAFGLTMNYSKQAGSLQMKLKKATLDFQTKGFVHFYTPEQSNNNVANITIDNSKINIKGRVVEKPTKSFNDIDADLWVYNSVNTAAEIILPKDYILQLNSNSNASTNAGYKLKLIQGGTKVISNDWDILSYTGIMQSNNTSTDKGMDTARLTFKVLGDVAVNGSGMKVDGINTPFGAMNMSFDFAQKRLLGTLQVKDVMLGTNTVNGTIETVFDPAGFYIAGGGSVDVLGIHPVVDGKYNLGIMLGSYPLQSANDHLWKVVTAYKQPEVANNCYINNIIQPSGNKLKGFYFTIDREIINKSIDFDFILASGYVTAKAILGADVYANFSNGLSVGMGAVAYAHAAAGMSALTGTSLNGSFTAKGKLDVFKNNNGFNISANIGLSFKAKILQSLMVTTVSKEISVGASAKYNNNTGFGFELTDGNLIEDCK